MQRKRRESSCAQAGLPRESTISAKMTAALPRKPAGHRPRGTLTFGAEAEVSGCRAMLILDGASIHTAVHGRRLHDGQGRWPLVPCTAEGDDPVMRAITGHSPGPDCSPEAPHPAHRGCCEPSSESSGAGGERPWVKSWSWSHGLVCSADTCQLCDFGQVT